MMHKTLLALILVAIGTATLLLTTWSLVATTAPISNAVSWSSSS